MIFVSDDVVLRLLGERGKTLNLIWNLQKVWVAEGVTEL
jgi:hypothetical protein